MGFPRIQTECYRALQWGERYENALRRLLVDKELAPDLRQQAQSMVHQVSLLRAVLEATTRAAPPSL